MRFIDIDKVKKHLDESKPNWTAEDYATACEDAEFYSTLEDFMAEHEEEIDMMLFAPALEPDEARWLQRKRNGYAVLVCSNCEKEKEGYTRTPFCPHCGRRMTEEAAGCT